MTAVQRKGWYVNGQGTARAQATQGGAGLGPYVVMGVSGSGKTTLASALARRLDLELAEADEFHSEANIAKMASGRPLNDDDRLPWLRSIGHWLAAHSDGGVVTCSALRRRYRDVLRAAAPTVRFLHLHGDIEIVRRRLDARSGHFMPASLLTSQVETLEPLGRDEPGAVLDLNQPVDRLLLDALNAVGFPPHGQEMPRPQGVS